MKLGYGKTFAGATIAVGLAATLAGCAMAPEPAPAPARPSITADMLIGNWGLASYRKDADKARSEAAARGQCNKPYVIGKGPSGGAMMYLADQSQAQELVVKAGDGGKIYLGPPSDPPGGQLDRELVSFDNNEFVTQWVDPEVATRYGTMVFVRCSSK
jgi:hypothetical protein